MPGEDSRNAKFISFAAGGEGGLARFILVCKAGLTTDDEVESIGQKGIRSRERAMGLPQVAQSSKEGHESEHDSRPLSSAQA